MARGRVIERKDFCMVDKKRTLEIDEELCNEVERLHYEYKALENVLTSYVDQHMLDPDGATLTSPVFDAFNARLVDALAAYERKKTEVVEKYGLSNVNWNLNFSTREIEIY